MTTPINNDKSMALRQDQPRTTENRKTPDRLATRDDDTSAQASVRPVETDEPDVSRAARLFDSESNIGGTTENPVMSSDDARSLVDRLKADMAADPQAALRAFGRADATRAGAVLAQNPA